MGRFKSFDGYIQEQWKIIKQAQDRVKLAKYIGKNAYETGLIEDDPSVGHPLDIIGPKSHLDMKYPDSDTRLRTSGNIDRSRENRLMDPVRGVRSKDPVYRKLSKVAELGDSGIIRGVINELHIMMENRNGMDELMYDYANFVSSRRILSELRDIEDDGGSLSEHAMIKRWHRKIEQYYQGIQEDELQEWLRAREGR